MTYCTDLIQVCIQTGWTQDNMLEIRVGIKCEPASHASHAVHWRIIEKHTIKIENSNTQNINWTLTIVNKCLTLKSA